ncbi:MAG TPA: hypothetical protein VGH44_00850 [Candidatus Saccharimonadia bacterium]|jgi:hypothetical protein
MQLKKLRPSRGMVISSGALFVVLAIAAGTWLVVNTKPIPEKYRQGLNYPLYYPTNLPNGYVVDRSSFQRKTNVLVFNINTPSGRNIAVSEERIPLGVDLSQHPNSSGLALPDQREFTTTAGTAEISFWGNKLVSSLVTPDTWVVLNVSGFTMNDAEKVTQSFVKL